MIVTRSMNEINPNLDLILFNGLFNELHILFIQVGQQEFWTWKMILGYSFAQVLR